MVEKVIIRGLIILFGILGISKADEGYPKRIVSLSVPLTEELYLLGVSERLVGVTIYCKRPPEVEKKERVGSCIDADIEKILSLTPDLVLASPLNNPRQIERIKDLGIKVILFNHPKDFSSLCERFLRLGRLVGRERVAREILKEVRKRVDTITKGVERFKRHKPKVFVQLGARPLFTVTKDSFIHEFIELVGGINIAQDAKSGLYSIEEVLKRDPEVIIIATMGIMGEEEKENWERFKTIKAVKSGRIYIMDSYKLCSPTPVSFPETLEEMIRFLHIKGRDERSDSGLYW